MEQHTPQLAPGKDNLCPFDYASTRYDTKIPLGVSLDDILVPSFWAHHAKDIRRFDEIRARAEDGSWVAYLLVLDSTRTAAIVKLLAKHELSRPRASDEDVKAFIEAHELRLRGQHKWCVVRKSDAAVIHQGREHKEDAAAWLEDHARQYAGAPKVAA